MQRRMEWLSVVSSGTPEQLQKLLESCNPLASSAGKEGSSVANSRDMSALARAGPCCGFEKLQCVLELEKSVPKFASCTSAEDVRAIWEETSTLRKLFKVWSYIQHIAHMGQWRHKCSVSTAPRNTRLHGGGVGICATLANISSCLSPRKL